MPQLLDILQHKTGFIVDGIGVHSSPNSRDDDEHEVFMGICKTELSPWHRRIDIKLYPATEFPFALLYFTGFDHFNRSMRSLAGRIGMHLTDKTLCWRVTDAMKDGQRVHCNTEEEIFKALGMKYKEPRERDI